MTSSFVQFKLLYFSVFSGKGVLEPYIPVFFEALHMSKSQIGILSMLPNINKFFVAPLFGIIGDKFDAHCEVLVFALVSSVVCTLAMLFTRSFQAMVLVVLAASALRAPVTPQVDALVINSLPDKSKYGEMRLWGAVSFGIFAFLGGAVTPDHTVQSFKFNFICYAISSLCSGFIVLYITHAALSVPSPDSHHPAPLSDSNRPSMLGAMKHVLARHPSVLVFAAIVFFSGVGLGVIDAFLFLRLKQLGGSGLVMGLSRFITCAAEVPMFHVAGRLQKKYGTWKMLAVTQVAFVLRFTYYSFLTEPWAVLPCEVLHGLTYATMWSALLEGLHWGFGSGVGALVGGFVYDNYGAVWLFEMSALLSLLSLVLAVLAYFFAAPDHQEAIEEGYKTVLSADSEHGRKDSVSDIADIEEVQFSPLAKEVEMKEMQV